MIIGIYRAVPQLDYSRVGIDRNLFKTDATDFPIPELDNIGMQTQFRCELSAPLIGTCNKVVPFETSSTSLDMSDTYGTHLVMLNLRVLVIASRVVSVVLILVGLPVMTNLFYLFGAVI